MGAGNHGYGGLAARPAARERDAASRPHRSASGTGGGVMFHHAVRGGHEHALVAVLPSDQVRRRSALPVNLGDHAPAVLITDVVAPDDDLVADFSAHRVHLQFPSGPGTPGGGRHVVLHPAGGSIALASPVPLPRTSWSNCRTARARPTVRSLGTATSMFMIPPGIGNQCDRCFG